MFKILGLLCLSTAYALSVMYLNGVKLSDSQVGLVGGDSNWVNELMTQCCVA